MLNNKKIVELVLPVQSDSTYYEMLVKHPPEGVEYVANKRVGVIRNTIKRRMFMAMKRVVRSLARKVLFSRPLYGKPAKGLGSIKHFAHCIPKKTYAKLSGYTYIVDVEGAWQLAVGKMTRSVRNKILKRLKSDKCLKVYAWTKRAYDEMIDVFPEIESKLDILYPVATIDEDTIEKKLEAWEERKKSGQFKMLYVARDFELKNGEVACEVMDTLSRIDNSFEGVIVSNIKRRKLKKLKKKYPSIKFVGLMPREELKKYYLDADVMVYPSPIDTFGFAIIEAMSNGTPTIAMKTLDTKSVEEIIDLGLNGVYFNKAKYLTNTIELLIELKKDRNKLLKLQSNCINEVVNGKFSLNERHRKLEEVFNDAKR